MKTLKFSHDYDKLPVAWIGTEAVLIGVFKTKMGFLQDMPAFLLYDTAICGGGAYHLCEDPELEWLVLSFIHVETGKPFTTIRRSYPEKERYYVGSIGERFVLEYTGGS